MENNPLFINFGALIFSSIEAVNNYLQLFVLLFSIGYTLYDLYKKIKKNDTK